jgi:hypothetical protein
MPSITAIKIALHYHNSEEDYPAKSAVVTGAINLLLLHGIIEERVAGKGVYRKTAALDHWVHALTRVPFPPIE